MPAASANLQDMTFKYGAAESRYMEGSSQRRAAMVAGGFL